MLDRSESLARHVLCAVPQLTDPNFRRSVVLMLDHDERGALGLVVNHLGRNGVGEVFGGLGLRWRGPSLARVRVGGPVEPNRGWILHDDEAWDPSAQAVLPGLWLTTSLDQVTAAGHHDTGATGPLLFLLGYAGWAPQQLEGEIAAGSWVPVPIGEGGLPATWLFHADPDAMWHEALRAIGIDPGRMLGLSSGTGTA
ncbi:MAG: YqgE/AlgH family protein [Nannocystaceae bacterium]|nr:YqgE/AlgH family protein [Nannocystaceae bacterium]